MKFMKKNVCALMGCVFAAMLFVSPIRSNAQTNAEAAGMIWGPDARVAYVCITMWNVTKEYADRDNTKDMADMRQAVLDGCFSDIADMMFLDFGYFTDCVDTLKAKGFIPQTYQLPSEYYYIRKNGAVKSIHNGATHRYVVESNCPYIMMNQEDEDGYLADPNYQAKFDYNQLEYIYQPKYLTDNQVPVNNGEGDVSPQVEALKLAGTIYNGVDYSDVFNAYTYYMNYPDLQTAVGANAGALLKHYVEYGISEGRNAR